MRILTLSQLSLAGSSGIAEAKIPLWWADGNYANIGGAASGGTTLGSNFLEDGSAAYVNGAGGSVSKLFTLSSTWGASTSFAFEGAIWSNNASYTSYLELWDMTSNSAVTASQISTISTTATVVRSGKFTLTPSHVYGITISTSATSGNAAITDASLIIFP